MHRPLALALLVVPPLAASPAGASDLELGLDLGAYYNSNLFGSPTDEEGDFSGRIGPRIRAMDELGKFTWDVRYWPTYEKYLDIGEADGWDHDVDVKAAWSPSRRTRLSLSERFLDTGNVNELFVQSSLPDGSIDPGFQFGRDRIQNNTVSLSLDHDLAARHSLNFGTQRSDNKFERQLNAKTEVTALWGSYLYALDALDRVGLRLSGTQQEVTRRDEFADENSGEPTRYYNLSLQWVHSFDPTLTLSASAGPTWVQSPTLRLPRTQEVRSFFPVHASSCPQNSHGEIVLEEGCEPFTAEELGEGFGYPQLLEVSEVSRRGGVPSRGEDITYFADITLTKSWREYVLTLSYSRDASTTSEISGIVLDNLSAYLRWTPSPRWSVGIQAYYQRREQPTSAVEGQALLEPASLVGTKTVLNPDGSVDVFTQTVPDFARSAGFRFVTRDRTLEVDDYLASIFVNYTLNRWTRLYVHFSYQYQTVRDELERSLFEESSWDRFYVAVGVTYTLPRFHLPF